MAEREQLAVGEILDGKYRVEALIGSGGMGAVYRARHIELDSTRAIKLMRPELAKDESFVHRFENEAHLAEGVRHPNVVALYDFASLPDEGEESLDARTDVFSLAAVAYAMMTGEPPFVTSSMRSFLHDLMIAPESAVRGRFAQALDEPWRGPLTRALARERQERPLTMEAFVDEIGELAHSPRPRAGASDVPVSNVARNITLEGSRRLHPKSRFGRNRSASRTWRRSTHRAPSVAESRGRWCWISSSRRTGT